MFWKIYNNLKQFKTVSFSGIPIDILVSYLYILRNILNFLYVYFNYISQRTQTSLRRLQDVLKRSRRLTTKPDVAKTSGKRRLIHVILKTSNLRRHQDILRTSDLQRLEDVRFMSSWKRWIYNILKTSDLRLLEDIWFMKSWRRPVYVVLRTSNLRRVQDVLFTTSWRSLIHVLLKTSNLRRLQDVCKRCLCSNVIVTSIQRQNKWFFLILYCLKYSGNFKCSCLG